jgi:teichuronic acid biosynthesis protein TuaE
MTFARLARQSLSRLSFSEVLRWGFLLMLPAAVLGSVVAWPGLRTLSAFRVLYVSLGLGAAAWTVYHRRLLPRTYTTPFLLFLVLWVAWTLASLLWAADKTSGIRYSIFLVMMVSLSGGTVLAVNSVKTLRWALLLLLVVFSAALAIGLTEALTDFRLPTSGLVGRPERYQWAVTSIFYNQNDFATYIALWLPFLLAVPFFARRVSVPLAAFPGSLLSVICLLYTGSRTNLLALSLVVPSLLLILALRRGTRSRWWQWVLGIAFTCSVVSVAYLGMRGALPALRLPDIGVQHWRFDTLGTEMGAGIGSGSTRIRLVRGGLAAALESHLLGVGPGNAEYHLRQMPGLETVYNLHNWWLEVLVDGGLFVFVGYLLFYVGLICGLFRVAVTARGALMAFAATALLAALVGYTVGALAPSSAIHFTPMWIHFGLSMAVINLHRTQRAQSDVES